MGWTFYNSNGEALVQHAESEATQAEMEAETAVAHFVPPDLVQKSPSAVKAQVFINAAGAISHAGTYGISGVDDDGTGDRGINFSTSFTTDDVYTAVETMYNSAGYIQASNWNKAYHDIITKIDDGTATDIISTGFFMGDT
jgi:proline dehydrogenase